MARAKVVEYYELMISEVDILSENLIQKTKDESKLDNINSKRSNFIQKINQILLKNLNYIQSNKIKLDQNESKLFAPLFCYIEIDDDFQPCLIVIAPHFINKTVRSLLKNCFVNCDSKQCDFITSQDVLIKNLVDSNNIINLSANENLVVKSFKINILENLKIYDFNIFKSFFDLNNLTYLYIGVHVELTISNDLFSNLNNLIIFEIENISNINSIKFQQKCLDLTSLREFKAFLKDGHFDLVNISNRLETLEIYSSCVYFKDLDTNSLKYASFLHCKMEDLKSFKTLENVKELNFEHCLFKQMQMSIFLELKFLVYLNFWGVITEGFQIETLNYLESIEFLDLRIRNLDINVENLTLKQLKYLSVVSELVPNLKVLNLEYLRIENLKKFDILNLLNLSKLVGLSIKSDHDIFKSIDKRAVRQLRHLVYLQLESNFNIGLENFIAEDLFYKDNMSILENSEYCFKASVYSSLDEILDTCFSFSVDGKRAALKHLKSYKNF